MINSFDNSKHEAEVKQRWGDTDAYRESRTKTEEYSNDKWDSVENEMNGIFAEFAVSRKSGESADSAKVQELVKKLQNYITEKFYHCTGEILSGLGQMYTCDERFRSNIDKNGEGTADFVTEAIKAYCKN